MKQKQHSPARSNRFKLTTAQAGILGIVLVLVGGILTIKAYQAGAETDAGPPYQFTPALQNIAANSPEAALPAANLPPEAQLEHWLAAGKPTLAFFHSDNCIQCIRMMEIVDLVYPDFAGAVALVDVNVYDQQNQNLLQRADIRLIPTMIFIDQAGQAQGFMGVMEPEVFREQLQRLAEE